MKEEQNGNKPKQKVIKTKQRNRESEKLTQNQKRVQNGSNWNDFNNKLKHFCRNAEV